MLQILLSGCPPFFGQNDQEIIHAVKHQDLAFDDPEWNEISAEAKDLIKKMLNRDEAKRFSAAQVLQHKWSKQWYKPDNEMKLESTEGIANMTPKEIYQDKSKNEMKKDIEVEDPLGVANKV